MRHQAATNTAVAAVTSTRPSSSSAGAVKCATAARSASIASFVSSALPRPASPSKARARASPSTARSRSLSSGTGSRPPQSIRHTSSKLARPASASTSWPAITSRPRSPSTSLSAVRATSTPSSPFALTGGASVFSVSIALVMLASRPPEAAYTSLDWRRDYRVRCCAAGSSRGGPSREVEVRNALAVMAFAGLGSSAAFAATNAELKEEVRQAETAFAKTMADRDHAAFASFLATETVFFGQGVMRGKAAVADGWKGFYTGKAAPFSWAPDSVEVLDSGELGMTSGPVLDPAGKRVGTFNSIWRKGRAGKWRTVFDKGCPPCDCGQAKPAP